MTAREWMQLAGLTAMTLLAAAILILIGHMFDQAVSRMTPDGKVSAWDAGIFTALLLSFREVISTVNKLWDSQERLNATKALSTQTPVEKEPRA